MSHPTPSRAHKTAESQLADKLGIEVLQLSASHAEMTMPVAGNLQPAGLLHGGASIALCEQAASASANVHAASLGMLAVGTCVSVSHIRSASSGLVTCQASAEHLGRRTTVHRVEVKDQSGTLLSSGQVTNQLIPRPSGT